MQLKWTLSFVVDAEPAPQWAGAAATWTRFFKLLPALSRAEPEFFIRTSGGKARRKATIPLAFFLFDEKQINISISESVFLTLQISPLHQAFPLVVRDMHLI